MVGMLRCAAKLCGGPLYSIAATAVGDDIYSFPGNDDDIHPEDLMGVCVFNTLSLRWTTLPRVTAAGGGSRPEVPCKRSSHTAVLIGDVVYVWGGACGDEFWGGADDNTLYAFAAATRRWIDTKVSGAVPGARWGHSACALRKDMYVYGGQTQLTVFTNDMYKLDTTTMVWSLMNTGGTLPPALSGHSASIMGTKMYVFGGEGVENDFYDDISVFDIETNHWLNTPSAQIFPKGRCGHSAFVYNGELYISGGSKLRNEEDFSNDMWKFNPESFSWKEVNLNVNEDDPFRVFASCCCLVGNRVIIFGGLKNPNVVNDDLYILDFSPSLKLLCKLAVIQYGLDQSEFPHDIRWELAAMTDQKDIKIENTKAQHGQL